MAVYLGAIPILEQVAVSDHESAPITFNDRGPMWGPSL
jgi:hypothetical protein